MCRAGMVDTVIATAMLTPRNPCASFWDRVKTRRDWRPPHARGREDVDRRQRLVTAGIEIAAVVVAALRFLG